MFTHYTAMSCDLIAIYLRLWISFGSFASLGKHQGVEKRVRGEYSAMGRV
ncbi:hypothetical protein BofuT4_uP118510.1 [Botrytis cinerea T4]|uniref:Uncharacterized protein n=1 Tax=Botryotinia fuckeliana (strain T4) TaxID=999810 RepID=G2Y0Y6_BOTF4|nr:hypothetical protein BofuT4_uP118510.1 [Botrytis cinerea T4]